MLVSLVAHDPLNSYGRSARPLPALSHWHFGVNWDTVEPLDFVPLGGVHQSAWELLTCGGVAVALGLPLTTPRLICFLGGFTADLKVG